MAAPPVVTVPAPGTPALPPSVNVSVQGPYEAAIIEGFRLLEKIIDGQPPDVKATLWNNWLTATQPFHDVSVALMSKVATAIEGLLK